MKKLFSLLFFIALALSSASQNENTKWYFGSYAALDFMTNPPAILNNSAMYASSGSSSIADPAGNLLFYANGSTVWNKQHAVMANGTGLLGFFSQPVMIIKQPNSNHLYYIFTTGGAYGVVAGLNYSVVDMSLAAGMGSVTVKNAPLYNSSCSYQLHATQRANGTDFWIMMHEGVTNNFRAYLLTASGINTVAVVSSVGTPYFGLLFGNLKFSHMGQKLASTMTDSYARLIELYDFDTNTGVVSNALTLNYQGAFEAEFSPDDTKLYSGGWGAPLIQWNLSSASPTAIPSSSVILDNNTTVTWGDAHAYAGIQAAPNGKIYVAVMGPQYLGVINNPNVAGAGCNWVYNGQPVSVVNGTSSSVSGLPNMITSFNTATSSCVTQIAGNPQSICSGNFYTLNGHTYTATGSYVNILQSASGCDSIIVTQLTVSLDTVNNLQNICTGSSYVFNNHTYTQTGTYKDTLQNVLGCDSIIITRLTVNNLPDITISADSTTCVNEVLTLAASGANTYTWSTNQTGASITVTPATTSTYSVTGTDSNACTNATSVVITINQLPNVTVTADQNSVCVNEPVSLTASGANTYTWSTAQTGAGITVTPAMTTTYSVHGTDEQGCEAGIQLTVYVSLCTGIEELKNENQELRIYPNPANDQVIIKSSHDKEELTIQIFDLTGRPLLSKQVKTEDHTGALNVDLMNGAYMISITNGKDPVLTKRLLIAK